MDMVKEVQRGVLLDAKECISKCLSFQGPARRQDTAVSCLQDTTGMTGRVDR